MCRAAVMCVQLVGFPAVHGIALIGGQAPAE